MSSAELEPVKPATLTERKDYAVALSNAGLLPDVYRGKPGNVLWAIEYGAALGVAPMTAIMGIHVIQGKPTLSADLMAALIRRAGHRLRVKVEYPSVPSEGGGSTTARSPVAIAELTRHDDPEFTFTARWDMERAKAAGLLGKDNWKHHPAAMLKARAISEVAREACSEVLNGLIYTPEEMGASVDEDGEPIVDGHVVEDQPKPGPQLHVRHKDGSREPLDLPDKPAAGVIRNIETGEGFDARTGERLDDQAELPNAFPDEPKEPKS